MRPKVMAVILVVILGVPLIGCQTPSGYYDPQASAAGGMLGGAATGAALGAIIGTATGNPGAGAWIGAASGAGAGALAGSLYARQQNQNLAQAQAQGAQGQPPPGGAPDMTPGIGIDQASVEPDRVPPGGQMTLTVNYHVMTPQNMPVPLNIVREISKDGRMIDRPYQEPRQVRNGAYTARVGFSLPQGAPPGGYVVNFRIFSPIGTAEKATYFSVQ